MNRTALIALAALLSSCVSVLPEAPPPSARWQIRDVAIEAAGEPVAWTLGLEDPTATRDYDTTKIAVTRAPGRIEYFSDGEWTDRAPRLIGAALLRSFENSGRIKGVGTRVTLPVSKYILQTDLRRFEADVTKRPSTVEAAIYVRLTNGRSMVYAARLFQATEPAGSGKGPDAASALERAYARLQREIVAWTFEEADKAAAASKK